MDRQVTLRLSAPAERQGETLEDFAANVLREHADQALAEDVEDAERWQRYLATGTAVPVERVRGRRLASSTRMSFTDVSHLSHQKEGSER